MRLLDSTIKVRRSNPCRLGHPVRRHLRGSTPVISAVAAVAFPKQPRLSDDRTAHLVRLVMHTVNVVLEVTAVCDAVDGGGGCVEREDFAVEDLTLCEECEDPCQPRAHPLS